MLALPNLLTTMVTGALDNQFVYSASKGSGGGYIQSVRTYTKPFDPKTVDQTAVRNAFKAASRFFFLAADKTIGAVTFTRADFLASLETINGVLQYRGVPTIGLAANRQLWIMADILQCKDSSDYTLFDVLPQDCTTGPQLQSILDNIAAAFALIANREQRDRIGYVS
jgi:hypothetical protein